MSKNIHISPFRTGALWRHDGELFIVVEVLCRESTTVPHHQHRALQADELGRPTFEVTMRMGRCEPSHGTPEPYDLSNLDSRQRLWLGHEAWLVEHATLHTASEAADRDLSVRLRRTPEMDD